MALSAQKNLRHIKSLSEVSTVDGQDQLTEAAEQTENRLMMLLDQERQEAKTTVSKLSADLARMTRDSQSIRDALVALEATHKEACRLKDKHESGLAIQAERSSELQAELEEERIRASSVEREFHAYKEEHKMSGDLEALQAAVSSLQTQLTGRDVKQK